MKLVLDVSDVVNIRYICLTLAEGGDADWNKAAKKRAEDYAKRIGMALDANMEIAIE